MVNKVNSKSMNWSQLITTKRFGMEDYHQKHDDRSEFERDFDRLVFSPAFRRLQNKTQVFPLPGHIFVHNRLTHSLEVSTVGKSIGNKISTELYKKYPEIPSLFSIGAIVSAACLAHDLGNPPFGHSGEKAIGAFFSESVGQSYKEIVDVLPEQWSDFEKFEGNANTFRMLTNKFLGRRDGGFVLTYSTLASIVKYPYPSIASPNGKNKFGFFQSDIGSYQKISNELGIPLLSEKENCFARFPLVYIVEAADDICYQIMDVEDAFKLKIFDFQQIKDMFFPFFDCVKQERIEKILKNIYDENEKIAYLRSSVIGTLVESVSDVFLQHEQEILNGSFNKSLISALPKEKYDVYNNVSQLSLKYIYQSQMVVDIELAGYKIIYELLKVLIEAIMSPKKAYSQQILRRIPAQYDIYSDSNYIKILSVLDYISGMTDVYALDLYRKINGMSLPMI